MKAYLMYPNEDWTPQDLPVNAKDLIKDLELDRLFGAMGAGDEFLTGIAKQAMLTGLHSAEEVVYRQTVLQDVLAHPQTVRELYSIAVEAIDREKRVWGSLFGKYPESHLNRSVEVLDIFVGLLHRLRALATEHSGGFCSEGFTRFFAMISAELSESYMAGVSEHLKLLKFKAGVRVSAELGPDNNGRHYVLRMPPEMKRGWKEWLRRWMEEFQIGGHRRRLFYQVADRDEAGIRAVSELRGRGLTEVAIALAQSTDHILNFFKMLRAELGFYVGCLNLRDRLSSKGEPICFPDARSEGVVTLCARDLYDVCLSLSLQERVVGNDVQAEEKSLVVITGANRGGKSTLLRSMGQSQLMMQCGSFVSATQYRGTLCAGVFTHFKREEDSGMNSGKLDEELSRMSTLLDELSRGSLVLFNESFGSTNEREGSEIARNIVRGLLESGVRVCYVTHMFDLAESLYFTQKAHALFLRAERLENGQRTFRLKEGKPLTTSFGADLYQQIFGARPASDLRTTSPSDCRAI